MTAIQNKDSDTAEMTRVTITLHGREYAVNCDKGEEKKLNQIVKLVDGKLDEMAGATGRNATETRLFMLTCLVLADELIETRKLVSENHEADEELMIKAVEHLQARVASIAKRIGTA